MGAERIIIASAATAAKYSGKVTDGVSSTPYPLVNEDVYGRDIVVPLTLRGSKDQLSFKEAVVNVSRSRNIVATPVLNGRGTVKEMITEGDLDLTITLAVVSNTEAGDYLDDSVVSYDTYPYNGVERLRKLLDEPERLDVVSDFLKLFDLDGGDFGIVVKSYSVHQDTHLNRQVFEIQAVSDYDYELLIGE
ncbi:MAG: DUF6046 domain-containing protein [Bacteroidales bacterium]|nr:DUF6046 domain-containing protein [Bacteroidales bacterium]